MQRASVVSMQHAPAPADATFAMPMQPALGSHAIHASPGDGKTDQPGTRAQSSMQLCSTQRETHAGSAQEGQSVQRGGMAPATETDHFRTWLHAAWSADGDGDSPRRWAALGSPAAVSEAPPVVASAVADAASAAVSQRIAQADAPMPECASEPLEAQPPVGAVGTRGGAAPDTLGRSATPRGSAQQARSEAAVAEGSASTAASAQSMAKANAPTPECASEPLAAQPPVRVVGKRGGTEPDVLCRRAGPRGSVLRQTGTRTESKNAAASLAAWRRLRRC